MNVLFILAGDPPSLELLHAEISKADLVIAVDGGANVFQSSSLRPDILIGDLDSINATSFIEEIEVLKIADQSQTDLQKALTWVFDKYSPNSLLFLGAGGGRVDHALNNLHICASIPFSVKIQLKRELSLQNEITLENIIRITPGINIDLWVKQGTILSVLPVTQFQGFKSSGLKWEINDLGSDDHRISQSNETLINDPEFTLTSGCVYIALYQ